MRTKWIALTAATFLIPPVTAQAQQLYNWSGFYVGVNAGTAIGQSNTRGSLPAGSNLGLAHDNNRSGGSAGAQIGANWHVAPDWLIGLEGDLNYVHVNKTSLDWFDAVSIGMRTNWYGTARVRLGYVAGPSLLYVSGGAASLSVTHTFGGNTLTGLAPTRSSEVAQGFVVGGGIETKLSRNWSTRLEYLYIDAGDHVFTANPYSNTNTATFQNKFHVVRGGLNYRFGDPSDAASATDAPMSAYSRNWSGLYAGANVGSAISVTHIDGTVGAAGQVDINGHGFSGGLQAGYNIMLNPKWFAGIEGDVGYLTLQRSFNDWNDTYIFSQKADWYATIRGRIGLNTGGALLYVTGGAAAVNITTGIDNLIITPGITRETALGWTLGAGTEMALNSRWSAKVESLHIDVGSQEEGTLNTGFPPLPRVVEFQRAFQVFRFGLNYRFGADDVGTHGL